MTSCLKIWACFSLLLFYGFALALFGIMCVGPFVSLGFYLASDLDNAKAIIFASGLFWAILCFGWCAEKVCGCGRNPDAVAIQHNLHVYWQIVTNEVKEGGRNCPAGG
jgi:hypothetical protein